MQGVVRQIQESFASWLLAAMPAASGITESEGIGRGGGCGEDARGLPPFFLDRIYRTTGLQDCFWWEERGAVKEMLNRMK